MAMKKAIIIGAGPAGLTAAYELLHRTDIVPIVFEKTQDIGGISKTVNYKGNRIDLGGHRFFSKSDRVTRWWLNVLPLQGAPAIDEKMLNISFGGDKVSKGVGPDPEKEDKVFLFRRRISRIYFLRKFFDYPISLSMGTFKNLGLWRVLKIGTSYALSQIMPIKPEKSLEDFFINRFGYELYKTFFKDYTEKVWGVPCEKIKPEWGAQRVKGLSIYKAILHALRKIVNQEVSLDQKNTETSLVERFLYPKYGPGQMWQEVAKIVIQKGGEINLGCNIVKLNIDENQVKSVQVERQGEFIEVEGDFFFSTMPVKELIASMDDVPSKVRDVSEGLIYRDFITVGLLLNRLQIQNETNIKTLNNLIPDTWIYIQERDVKLGRLQIFNNWSPYLISDRNKVWIGLEYFCNEGDSLWNMEDNKLIQFATDELEKIGIISQKDVLDATVLRHPKTYPAYFGTYDQFHIIRDFTDKIKNLFLIGRNGMHRYNKQDHSMLTAMTSVDNIINKNMDKSNIWAVNTEQEYIEEKK